MTDVNIPLPDGTSLKLRNVPEDATEDDFASAAQEYMRMKGATPSPETPFPVPRPTGQISAGAIESRQQHPFPGQSMTPKSPVAEKMGEITKPMVLPTAGAAAGVVLGAAAGPFAPAAQLTLASVLSAGGEKLNQILGITPEDQVQVGIAGVAPFVGPLTGKVLQKGISRPFGTVVEKLPITQVARANAQMRAAIPELQSVGASIMQKNKGLPSRTLYRIVEDLGVDAPASSFQKTHQALSELAGEMENLKMFSEIREALDYVRSLESAFVVGGDPVSFKHLVGIQQQLGGIVGRAEAKAGQRFGAAKKLYGALWDDIDALAQSPNAVKVPARIMTEAVKRAKLEFSIRKLESTVASNTVVKGDDVVININSVRNSIRHATDPKHPDFDKNFAEALKNDLPGLESRLRDIDRITQKYGSGPAGPGSIIIRGIGAQTGRMIAAGMLGFAVGDAPGLLLAAGAMVGTNLPEIIVGALSSPKLLNTLNRMASAGKGSIDIKKLAVLSTAVLNAAGPRDKTRETIRAIEERVGG